MRRYRPKRITNLADRRSLMGHARSNHTTAVHYCRQQLSSQEDKRRGVTPLTAEPPAICGPINATVGDTHEGDTLAVFQQTTQHHVDHRDVIKNANQCRENLNFLCVCVAQ